MNRSVRYHSVPLFAEVGTWYRVSPPPADRLTSSRFWLSLPFSELFSRRLSSGSSAPWTATSASIAVPTPPTSGRPPPWIAVSYFDWALAAGIPT